MARTPGHPFMRLLLLICIACLSASFCAHGAAQELAPDELRVRVAAALEARNSGNPSAIEPATRQLIAIALVRLAKLRLDVKDYESAAKLSRESVEFEDSSQTRVEAAIASLYAQNNGDAIKQASLAAEMEPANTLAWTIKGEALLRSEDYAGAIVAFSRALALKQDAEPLHSLGMAYLGLGDQQKAEDAFDRMLQVTGDAGWSRVFVGRAYERMKFPNQAIKEFRRAIELNPSTPGAHYYWGYTALHANDWNPTEESQQQFQEELKLNPRNLLANYLLGICESIQRNYQESDRHLQLVQTQNPNLTEAVMYLGLNANARGDKTLAEKYFRKAIVLQKKSRDPSAHRSIKRAYFALGRILINSGRKAEGETMLAVAREMQVANLSERKEEVASMKTENGEGVSGAVVPDIPEASAQNFISLAPTQSEGPGASNAVRTKAEAHLRSLLGSSFNDLATAEALQAKFDFALKHYLSAQDWDSHIPGLQRNLGLAYFATNDFANAAKTLAPIAALPGQDPQVVLVLAKSLLQTGRTTRAINVLQRMDTADVAPSAEQLVEAGKLWQQMAQNLRAERDFRRALKLDPENAAAKCALGLANCSTTTN